MENNYVSIGGRVKADATANSIRAGLSVINFTLMVDGPKEGDRPTYVDCASYDQHVIYDILDGYVNAGEWMHCEGYLSFRTFTDSNGAKRSGMIVQVTNVGEEE